MFQKSSDNFHFLSGQKGCRGYIKWKVEIISYNFYIQICLHCGKKHIVTSDKLFRLFTRALCNLSLNLATIIALVLIYLWIRPSCSTVSIILEWVVKSRVSGRAAFPSFHLTKKTTTLHPGWKITELSQTSARSRRWGKMGRKGTVKYYGEQQIHNHMGINLCHHIQLI